MRGGERRVPAPPDDPLRECIEAFNRSRGGGVLVQKAAQGYTLVSERTEGPIARLKPMGDADTVQVLWWNGRKCRASGPLGIATMSLDKALHYIAADPIFWINA